MSKNKYDYIILGSGLEALLKNLELEQQGLHGCVVEKEELAGGLFRGLRNNDAVFESHLCYLPDTPALRPQIETLQNLFPELSAQSIDVGPLTFQNGQVQPFVGFGETSNEAVDLYSQWTHSPQWLFSKSIASLIADLRQKMRADFLNLSEVTSLELSPDVVVTLNGATPLKAQTVYCYDSPLKLSKWLLHSKTTPLPKTLVPKLSKTVLWTSISLIYQHQRSLTESRAVHVLYGSKEQPSLGRFLVENDTPTSQWLCLVGPETAADSESLGSTIREMKKQIKRMYPSFFETVEKENIIISPESYGLVNPQLLENDGFHKVPHLKLGSRFFTNGIGLWGDLQSLSLGALQTTESSPSAQL